ncbi:GNAT family N-acetyltransferase [Orenia marismortui]|uniref:N-acetyltransferase domain-containing protein n=1 Tax=Orenia marismortui TaxID=46469 RepID=A0A4R8H031_9FIRM|nr:GNAT family N-acetyltransferase [Orenia marismortui]TDX52652.1 hypothetical protein C7959_1056 [Orenia marismortui]
MNIVIKEVSLDNIDTLVDLAKITFQQAYGSQNKAVDIADYLENNFNREEIKLEFNNRNNKFFMAYLRSQVVGYFKLSFSKVHKSFGTNKVIKLERLYLLKDYIGKKIGKKLMLKAIEVAKDHNIEYLWLGVWKENKRAVDFYKSWGFEIFAEELFFLGEDTQEDWLMKKSLY